MPHEHNYTSSEECRSDDENFLYMLAGSMGGCYAWEGEVVARSHSKTSL